MPSLYTEIEIDVPKPQVWRILFQKDRWKYWNTFLYDCDCDRPFTQGQETILSLRRVSGEEPIEFQPIVTLVQQDSCLQWVSTIPGFRNEHVFELQDIGRNRTKYIHQERFSGPLSKMFLPFIRRDEQQGIQRMAWELKHYAERSSQRFRD
ncbi:SRPBCC domain-containing protein [Phormidesmis priestleyi ULC007]|uniref:SRPBCC domain-containing protein n=1 Tax=Phormidesmis priestleyi ULC007 TaxID=1920490 RepID=A0A2T1D4M7_9CYAN|nr:SRPBCC domain-containing protein [Phormidesmis priestleyi]PSB15386.1 SRPBCC domain-containing protein [Phormidesmis priestleyi ULC007]PZO46096.1 MAG: SRPBCC domain-containing protein [Phormidesmis priestleyi]